MAMILLTLAVLLLFDGLRSGIFGTGDIRLIPGESYVVSGPLPPKTDRVEDFVIEGNSPDGSMRLVPEGTYTGYWFGGGMWRGHIAIDANPRPGTYVIKVRDRLGEKQNPALVFTVRVFANAEDRRLASPSMAMRWTGFEPFLLAAVFCVLGIVAGIANYLLGRKWTAVLMEHGCGEIFRLKMVDGTWEAGVDMGRDADVPVGATFRFTHPARGELGHGRVVSCERGKITLQVSPEASVRPGDIACPVHV
jgi:hypothetical protein